MSSAAPSPDSPPARSSYLGWAGVAFLILAGTAAGYFLPSGADESPSTKPLTAEQVATASSPAPLHRFPLTLADRSESVEAPTLCVDRDQRVHLAWASQTGESQRTLYLVTSHDEGQSFSSPRAVTRSAIHFASGGKYPSRMSPHLAAAEDLYLSWSETINDNTAVRLVVARSKDGGKTFGESQPAHRITTGRASYTALAVSPTGQMALSWLDNRHGRQQLFANATFAGEQPLGEESLVYAGQEGRGICPCCATATAIADDGTVYVAFRNQHDGYRDIWLAQRGPDDAAFSESQPIVPPTWQFDGCPHDGPSLVIAGEQLHVVWMDAHSGQPRCYHGRAARRDGQFTVQELHPAAPGTQGNAQLGLDARGKLYAVWEASLTTDKAQPAPTPPAAHGHAHGAPAITSGGRAIMIAHATHADGQFSTPKPIAPQPGAYQTRPTLAAAADGTLYVAWHELTEAGKSVVVTRIEP